MNSQIYGTHQNIQFANKSFLWSGSDSEQRFDQHLQDPTKRKILQDLGWTKENIIYNYNSAGFRDRQFDSTVSGIALGCSITEGTGVREDQTWPRVLEQLTKYKIWNLGVAGCSLDCCFRILDYWINHLNAKFVCLLAPPVCRTEVFADNKFYNLTRVDNHITPDHDIGYNFFKVWASEDLNVEINQRKNILAMSQICENLGIPFVYEKSNKFNGGDPATHNARDLMHPGPALLKTIANHMFDKLKERV